MRSGSRVLRPRFPDTVLLTRVRVPQLTMPVSKFSDTVLLTIVSEAPSLDSLPLVIPARRFPETVTFVNVSVPWLSMPLP